MKKLSLILFCVCLVLLAASCAPSTPTSEAKKIYEAIIANDADAYLKLLPPETLAVIEEQGIQDQFGELVESLHEWLASEEVTNIDHLEFTETINGDTALLTVTVKESGEEIIEDAEYIKIGGKWRQKL